MFYSKHSFKLHSKEVRKMAISKEERAAYEEGLEEADYIRNHTLSFALSGGINTRPDDDSLASAYDKGLGREKLDDDKK